MQYRQQDIARRGQMHLFGIGDAIEANEDLVHWVVQRQIRGRLAYEDAVQEGRIALWRALERHDAARSRLSSYAVVAIRRAVWTAAGRARRQAAQEGLEVEPAGGDDLATEVLSQSLEGILLRQMVSRLPERLRRVVVLRYGLDGAAEHSFTEIGQMLGVSKQRAHQLHGEAILRLADPGGSTELRRQTERNSRIDIQRYLARRRAWQRTGRRRR